MATRRGPLIDGWATDSLDNNPWDPIRWPVCQRCGWLGTPRDLSRADQLAALWADKRTHRRTGCQPPTNT